MNFKIAIIILAFKLSVINNVILASGAQAPAASSDIITADEVIKEIKKLNTHSLIEMSFNKKISAQDKKQVLDKMQSEIQYYQNSSLSTIGKAIQIARLTLGFWGTVTFLAFFSDELHKKKYYSYKTYSYQSNKSLAAVFFGLGAISLSQFILGIKRLHMNSNLITMRNMELFVKVMPVKR